MTARPAHGAAPFLSLLAFFCLITPQEAWPETRVSHVIDGDTVVLETGTKVRYPGINTPEVTHEDRPGEPFGDEARLRNRELVEGKRVTVRTVHGAKRDRFGRLLADLVLEDGRSVSEILVQEGLAFVCIYNNGDKTENHRLLELQRKAIEAKRGMWSAPAARPEPYYIGNTKSLRFHRPSCPFGKKTSKEHRKLFKEREAAFREGFCPCKKCLP